MLRKVIRRGFCVDHNDPFHSKNIKNDHRAATYRALQENFQNVKGNFQDKFLDNQYLERSQIQTRILKLLYQSELVQRLDKFQFSQDMRKQLNLDSLNITVILTAIEHEFTTVFQDRVFDSVRNIQEIVTLLMKDPKIF